MPEVTEDVAATAQPDTSADTSLATQGSEPANPSPSDAGTVAAPQPATQADATVPSSLHNPIRRSDPPDSVVHKVTPPAPLAPPVAKPEVPPVAPQAQPTQQQQPPVDWQKRFQDSQPFISKLQQENQSYRQQIQQVQEWQQRQQQVAGLKIFNRDHPENGRFNALRERLRAQYDLANEMPPEQRGDAIARINARVSDADKKHLEDWNAYRQADSDRSPEEREDRYRDIARQTFAEQMQQYEQFQNVRSGTQQFLQQNGEIIAKHADEVLQIMNSPARKDIAIEMVKLREENEKLRHQVLRETQEVETARARDAITKQRATVRRDATSAVVSDPAAEATRLGLRGDAAFDFITKHRNQQ